MKESGKAIAIHQRRVRMAYEPEGEALVDAGLEKLWAVVSVWRHKHPDEDTCVGCGRVLTVNDGYCRLCWQQARYESKTAGGFPRGAVTVLDVGGVIRLPSVVLRPHETAAPQVPDAQIAKRARVTKGCALPPFQRQTGALRSSIRRGGKFRVRSLGKDIQGSRVFLGSCINRTSRIHRGL
jgi:hypothetical protein